jgi:adenylate cyclase
VNEQRVQRQLSAILAADVAGYSRLMGVDEEGTLARLKELRRTLIDPKITEHRGRIVKTMGDGLLVQFASAVDAMRCAGEAQREIAKQHGETAEDRRIEFRMGINVGDIVIEGDDIYGEGVNVAARLEGLSEPGGLCVTTAVYDQVRDKLDISFEDTGEHQLKNNARPVRAYRALMSPAQKSSAAAQPSKPSIAVPPFINMSGDPEQTYFSDGITEDIITELARFRPINVIARNASFRFRGDDIDVVRAGRELGAQYILEGSVRKLGNKVRITAQLIDAGTGSHVWANRFDTQEDYLQSKTKSKITGKYSSYAAQLRQQRDQLQLQLSGVETELSSVYQSSQRLGSFQPRSGLVYSCPQCWIDTATSSPLRAQAACDEHEGTWACTVYGSQFSIPKLEVPGV